MVKVDVKGGELTFGQRLELGRIVADESLTELDKFKKGLEALGCKGGTITERVAYWHEVLEGLVYWVKREAQLKYEPKAEEKAAGIQELTRLTGDMGTVMALAKDFSVDPDVILEWKYGKVYNILYVNLQNFLYNERLEKEREKHRNKGRKSFVG